MTYFSVKRIKFVKSVIGKSSYIHQCLSMHHGASLRNSVSYPEFPSLALNYLGLGKELRPQSSIGMFVPYHIQPQPPPELPLVGLTIKVCFKNIMESIQLVFKPIFWEEDNILIDRNHIVGLNIFS